MTKKARITALLKGLNAHWKAHARETLPWRTTTDPYKILVSEVMLQQTQVRRVVPFYERFIRRFPNAKTLARAKFPAVLRMWKGLGYNRRAKYLHDAAKIIAKEGYTGQRLPGVGEYTACAISAFAYNRPEVFIETNIRTVFLYFCFPGKKKVSDKEILPLVCEALNASRMQPRQFYAALMDYGSYLKQNGVRLNSRSAHYVKQTRFEGSRRQKRATLLWELLTRGARSAELERVLYS